MCCSPNNGGASNGLNRKNMSISAKLIFLCGKMAAGKSTRQMLVPIEERAGATRLCSLIEGYLRRTRLSWQYKGAACLVP
jgi:hypothetical protein